MAKSFFDLDFDSLELLKLGYPADGAVKVFGDFNIYGLICRPIIKRNIIQTEAGDKENVEIALQSNYVLSKVNQIEFSKICSTNRDWQVDISSPKFGPKLTATIMNGGLIKASCAGSTYTVSALVPLAKKSIKLAFDKVIEPKNGLFFGLSSSIEATITNIQPPLANTIVAYMGKGFVVHAFLQNLLGENRNFGAGWHQNVAPGLRYGCIFEVTGNTGAPTTTVGGEYQLSKDEIMKGKIILRGARARIAVAYKKKITSSSHINVGMDFFPHTIGDNRPFSFGIEIKLS